MRHRAIALAIAAISLGGVFVLGFLVMAVPAVRARDAAILHGFTALDRPRGHDLIDGVIALADPLPYGVAGLVLIGVAIARGRRWRAVAVGGLLVVTGATTQVAKHVLVQPRFEAWLGTNQIGDGSWPSGHATAAMTLALCAVLVAPARLRPVIAVAGAAFALAVGYGLVVLAWHYPSDVLGGYLVAGLWASLALAALSILERSARVPSFRPRARFAGAGLALAAGGGAAAVALTRDVFFAASVLERPTLIAGALAIAVLATALPTALARAA